MFNRIQIYVKCKKKPSDGRLPEHPKDIRLIYEVIKINEKNRSISKLTIINAVRAISGKMLFPNSISVQVPRGRSR